MARRLSFSALMLASSTVPAFAGSGGGAADGVGALLVQAVGYVIRHLF